MLVLAVRLPERTSSPLSPGIAIYIKDGNDRFELLYGIERRVALAVLGHDLMSAQKCNRLTRPVRTTG